MNILIFDSGLGGLTVFKEIGALLPGARYIYAADNAAFPYGAWEGEALGDRVFTLIGALIEAQRPDMVVIACNTVSTLVLPRLRARFSIPFVGTVPAIKPAAQATRSGLISVLATPGTVSRDYTKDLIRDFAGDCAVTLVGSQNLAAMAEAKLAGGALDGAAIAAEIAPAFVEIDGARTDHVVLACTHYPWLLDDLAAAAPWPVRFVDPAPAIARRVAQVAVEGRLSVTAGSVALFTAAERVDAAARRILSGFGLTMAGSIDFTPPRA